MKSVFISHAVAADKEMAEKAQRWIKLAYGNTVTVFVSSVRGIGTGDIPVDDIAKALRSADITILLLSPKSISNSWIVFEAGAAFGRGKKIVPILCKGATVNSAPGPLRAMIQMKDASDDNDFYDLISTLDDEIGKNHAADIHELQTMFVNKPYIGAPVAFSRKRRNII